jgi:hypothetical protein
MDSGKEHQKPGTRTDENFQREGESKLRECLSVTIRN